MSIEANFIELAKRHNTRFGTNYPTTSSDLQLFFYSGEQDRAVSTALLKALMEQMKVRLMTADDSCSGKSGDVGFYKFLTGTIVLGVVIASIIRAAQ